MKVEIQIAEKLNDCHRVAKECYGDQFDEKVLLFIEVIRGFQKKHGTSILDSVINICKDEVDDFAKMMFFAAAVELLDYHNQKIQ